MVRNRTTTLAALAAIASLMALAGCASTATPSGPATVTVTSAPTTDPAVPNEPIPAEPATPAAGKVKVPNGVGKDYQSAQDAWRAAGLVVMPGIDATGANRLMVLDSNWVVISQNPAAGTKVEDGSEITATVKKYTDK